MTESGTRPTGRDHILALALPLAVALTTFVVFLPALWNDFVNWDDHINFVNNKSFRGLGWENLRWMFTTTLMGHYIPFTWMTLAVDYLVWGLKPFGYHLTNVVLHATNAALVAVIARRLLARAMGVSGVALGVGAAVSALVFSLHPLRAESVAWVTERRDVLSGAFFLSTILLYLVAADLHGSRRRWFLAGSIACYTLAVGSKSIVMSLPLVLVILDIYPLRRLPANPRTWLRPPIRGLWLEKLPFVVLALVCGAVSYYAVAANSFVTPLERYPWSARVGMVMYSLWFYVSKTAVPRALSPLYELPVTIHPLEGPFLVSLVGVTVITVAVVALAYRWPAGLAVWAYYGIVLAPVSGLVHSGHQLAHDRYSYLSCLGFALLAGALASVIARRAVTRTLRPGVARVAAAGGAAALAGLGILTWFQVQAWRDGDTLWRTALEADPSCSICQANLGTALITAGYLDLARERFERVVELRPDRVQTHLYIGITLANLGKLEEAIGHFERVLAKYPDDPDALSSLGVTLGLLGRHAEALEHLRHAARIKPTDANIQVNLAAAFLELKRAPEALNHYRRAIELEPELAAARSGLARTYILLGRASDAQRELEVLRRLDPVRAAQLQLPTIHDPAALAR